MQEIIDLVSEAFVEHWIKVVIGAALMGGGWLFGRWRAQVSFRRKEFFHRINFSLNSVHEGTLKIRTLLETRCEDVFLNQIAVSRLLDAATRTTEDDPVIPLDEDDYWFFLNASLNELSEKFAFGFLKRDTGVTAQSVRYVLCLTNEVDGNIRTRKIRAMLIRRELLDKLPEEMPRLESQNHKTRWATLQAMARKRQSHPYMFMEAELVI